MAHDEPPVGAAGVGAAFRGKMTAAAGSSSGAGAGADASAAGPATPSKMSAAFSPIGKSPGGLSAGQAMKLKGVAQQRADRARSFRPWYIIEPRTPQKIGWDVLIGFCIIYSVVVIPFRLSFDAEARGLLLVWETCIDFLFGFDMVATFLTAYKDITEKMVYAPRRIAAAYLRSWFIIDFLSTVPFDRIIPLLLSEGDSNDGSLRLMRLIRVMRLFRLLKLMRLLKLGKKFGAVNLAEYVNPGFLRLGRLMGVIVFTGHLIACFWFMVNSCTATGLTGPNMVEGQDEALERYGPDTWDGLGWKYCGGENVASKYLAAFYWTIATMMAVGYGDIGADTGNERGYAMATQIAGSISFGFIIATVTVIVETLDPHATAKREKIEEVREYASRCNMPKPLVKRLRQHFKHYYSINSVFHERQILSDLPPSLRMKLLFDTRAGLLAGELKLRMFERTQLSFVSEVAAKLRPMQLAYGEVLGQVGDVSCDVFFVVKGAVLAKIKCAPEPDDGAAAAAGGAAVEKRSLAEAAAAAVAAAPPPLESVLVGVYTDGDEFELNNVISCAGMSAEYESNAVTDLMWLEQDTLWAALAGHEKDLAHLNARAAQASANFAEAVASDTVTISGRRVKSLLVKGTKVAGCEAVLEEAQQNLDGETKHRARLRVQPAPLPSPRDEDEDEDDDEGEDRYGKPSGSPGGGGGGGSASFPGRSASSAGAGAAAAARAAPPSAADADGHDGLVEVDAGDLWTEHRIISPHNKYKVRWDVLVGALTMFSILIVPMRLGFPQCFLTADGGEPIEWFVVDMVVDCSFALDILLNFRTAIEVENSCYIVDYPSIWRRYSRSWFIIDFMSTFPFDRAAESAMDQASGADGLKGIKLVRIVRIIRLLKLARVLKLKNLEQFMEDLEVSVVFERCVKMFVALVFVAHLSGCFWSFVSAEAETVSWWLEDGLDPRDLHGRYVAALYWAFTTMTTVGYGDILPTVDSERLYATVIMLLGATVFGYIVGTVSTLAHNPNGSSALERDLITTTEHFLEESAVDGRLRKSAQKHIEFVLSQRAALDEARLLAMMPVHLRTLAVVEARKEVIGQLPLFASIESVSAHAYLLRYLKPMLVTAKSMVNECGAQSQGVYFVLQGVVEVLHRERLAEAKDAHYHAPDTTVGMFNEGDLFGQVSVLDEGAAWALADDASDEARQHAELLGAAAENVRNLWPLPRNHLQGERAYHDTRLYLLSNQDLMTIRVTQPHVMRELERALVDCSNRMLEKANEPRRVSFGSNRRFKLGIGKVLRQIHAEKGLAEVQAERGSHERLDIAATEEPGTPAP